MSKLPTFNMESGKATDKNTVRREMLLIRGRLYRMSEKAEVAVPLFSKAQFIYDLVGGFVVKISKLFLRDFAHFPVVSFFVVVVVVKL